MLRGLVGAMRPTGERPLTVHTTEGVYMSGAWAAECEASHVVRSCRARRAAPTTRAPRASSGRSSATSSRGATGVACPRGVPGEADAYRVVPRREDQRSRSAGGRRRSTGGTWATATRSRPRSGKTSEVPTDARCVALPRFPCVLLRMRGTATHPVHVVCTHRQGDRAFHGTQHRIVRT